MYTPEQLDNVSSILMINLYSIGKSSKEIQLLGLDRKKKSHLAILHGARIAAKLYKFELRTDCNWWDRFYLRLKGYKLQKIEKVKTDKDVDKLIRDIELPNNYIGAFEQFYTDFMEKK